MDEGEFIALGRAGVPMTLSRLKTAPAAKISQARLNLPEACDRTIRLEANRSGRFLCQKFLRATGRLYHKRNWKPICSGEHFFCKLRIHPPQVKQAILTRPGTAV